MSSPSATRSSLSWARWRSRQRADAVAGHRDEQPHVGPAGVLGDRAQGLGVVLGQLALGLRGHDDPLDREGAPRHLVGPGDPGEQLLQARGLGQVVLLDGAQRARDGVVGGHPLGEVGLVLEQLLGGHEGEQAHRLVPPAAGDVPLGVERGEGERVGHGLGGVGHRTMVPDPRAGGRGTLLAHGRHGEFPTAGRGEQ